MAEQVNQRIEDMINELEQMRRTELYDDEEIREISRRRKEFEYRVQRRVKQKEDYVHYIAYELALLEDISSRRKKGKLQEKKKDIEYAIAKRLNKIFKQFIYRFQNDIEVYFQYIQFCRSVGFESAVSGVIGQMLQIHGDKPKMWQLASKWESEEQNNLDGARAFLLKGIQRHPESETLYLELFKIELMMLFKDGLSPEEKDKQIQRAGVIWRNGVKNIHHVSFLFKLCDMSILYGAETITDDIKKEIWSRNSEKDVWVYVGVQELKGVHWEEIEEYKDENDFPKVVAYCLGVFDEALTQFPDEKLCTKYIHSLLKISEDVCLDEYKIKAVKHAWMFGHENGLLSNDMYKFGIEFLKLEGDVDNTELEEILDAACKKNPKARFVWKEKILLNKDEEKKMLAVLQEASKVLESDDALYLWNLVLDNIVTSSTINNLYKKFKNCETMYLMSLKPKFLQKMYEHSGIKSTRQIYEEMIRTPPTQIDIHYVMISIETSQENPNNKLIRKCYECAVQHHGADNVELWLKYMKFEMGAGNAQASPAIYRRAIASLKKELVDEFIKAQTLAKLNI